LLLFEAPRLWGNLNQIHRLEPIDKRYSLSEVPEAIRYVKEKMQEQTLTPDQIVKLIQYLPGDKAFKILAPGTRGRPKFEAQLDSDRMLLVASAIKTFVPCEALRQIDSPDIVDKLKKKGLGLDSNIWSLGSPTFNPPP
jgi:hypothetical protein